MKAPMRATKKPVTIEFIEWTGKNHQSVFKFMYGKFPDNVRDSGTSEADEYYNRVQESGMTIESMEGVHTASIGDMIIKGVKGEFYYCNPEIFSLTYNIDKDVNILD